MVYYVLILFACWLGSVTSVKIRSQFLNLYRRALTGTRGSRLCSSSAAELSIGSIRTMGAKRHLLFELNTGSLFRLDGSNITKIEEGITVSNGLSWDLREKAMYYIDSWERKIRRYDYDVDTGNISNLTYIFDFYKYNIKGFPDGQTIDTDGNLWVAVFEGSCVIKIDPRTGNLLKKVKIPAVEVTSVIFGGPNYDILFVTSANMNYLPPPNRASFMVMVTGLGVKGTLNPSFKIKLA